MTETDLAIYSWIRTNIQQGSRVSVKAVSSALDVSEATVSRLAKKLGYDGWDDLVAQMTIYLHGRPRNASSTPGELEMSIKMMAEVLQRHCHSIVLLSACGDAEVCRSHALYRLAERGYAVMTYTDAIAEAHADKRNPGLSVVINESGMALWECCQHSVAIGYEAVAITSCEESPVSRLANLSITIDDNKTALSAYEPNLFAAGVIAFLERAIARLPLS